MYFGLRCINLELNKIYYDTMIFSVKIIFQNAELDDAASTYCSLIAIVLKLTFLGGGSFFLGFSVFCSVSGAACFISALSDFLVSMSDNTTKKWWHLSHFTNLVDAGKKKRLIGLGFIHSESDNLSCQWYTVFCYSKALEAWSLEQALFTSEFVGFILATNSCEKSWSTNPTKDNSN